MKTSSCQFSNLLGLVVPAVILGLPLVGHGALSIDSFLTEQTTRVGADTTAYSSMLADETLGGERDIRVQRLSSGKGPVEASAGIPEAGLFSLNTGVSTRGVATLVWDGKDGKDCVNFGGLNSFDLTQQGANSMFSLSAGSDLGAQFRLRVYESATVYSEYKAMIPGASDASPLHLLFPFSDFKPSDEGAARFDKVGAITLEILGDKSGSDVLLGELSVIGTSFIPVPEASTAAAGLGLAAFALVSLIRRRVATATSL
ncbi:MAG: hypothetical protein HYR88_02420 [Verrucomicrobia bacterium]|nr:hypothetical protein [Verrucomicrobiota bacterium]MBI3870640.1 hypothetical protein [Verrucomicrobiota bacterium]